MKLIRIIVHMRNGTKQSLCIWMVLVSFKKIKYSSGLHNLSRVNHSDLLTGLGNNSKVMRNQQNGRIQLFLELIHHLKHLSLNSNIQCSCWFIRQ